MIQENLKASGKLHLVLRDKDGNIILEREETNLVVGNGKAFITSRMLDASSAVMTHMAIGTNNTAAATGQTALSSEAARVVLASTTRVQTGATANDSIRFVATFGPGVPASTNTIVEAGVFNNSTGGTMLCRSVFGGITKTSTDTLTVTWTVALV